MAEEKGLWFPDGLEIPEDNWYRIEFGGNVVWDLDREGHVYLARQYGMVSLKSEITSTGTSEGILYAAVEAELEVDPDQTESDLSGPMGGSSPTRETYRAVSGADETSQQVRDPEHVWSVAESRAIKRVVKRALGIRSVEATTDIDAQNASEPDTTPPDGGEDGTDVSTYPDPENNDDDIDW